MPYDQPMESPGRRRGRSRTPHGQKRRESSVETIRANSETQGSAPHLRQYEYRSEKEPITTFRHEAGPDFPPGFNFEGNGNSPRTQELLARIADGIRKNAILGDENERLKGEKEELKGQNEELMEENASLSSALGDLQREFQDMVSRNHNLKNKIEEMRQATTGGDQGSVSWFLRNAVRSTRNNQVSRDAGVSALLTETTKYKKRVQELTAENREMSQRVAEQAIQIQKQRTEFAQELDDLMHKAFAKGARVSDTEIQTKWKTLGFSVRQLVSEYFPEPLDSHTAQLLARQELFKWLPEPAIVLQAPMLYQVALESWVWHCLCFQIFDSHSSFWAGEVGKAFRIQCDGFRDMIANMYRLHVASHDAVAEKFHDWRIRSADFISILMGNDETGSVASLARQMLEILDPAIPSEYSFRGHTVPGLQQDLLRIIREASHLAGIFRASKANFQVFITRIKLPLVTPPSFGFPFDAETMEIFKGVPLLETEGSTPVVDLAVSPGILKTGNADGTNYNSERVLVKLQTLCNLRRVLELYGYGAEQQVRRSGQEAPIRAEDGYTIEEQQAAEADTGEIVVKSAMDEP
ncbi:hypothetical protein B0I37DRAFT_443043 [Chaetomium sp. MPI-CAGE-AT-0009]|nr:hypothetical protein B0I37DRAFT_443043 [Chaetomium sp. MPI-CAGE-AT-0009]